ncbi:MAG: hypothetical protein QG670_2309 [Thermoproteota archaeon]|nr:hypothetical protein [Thermoproteota archaeon]
MLPTNLLVTRRRRDTITPAYAELNETNIEMIKHLIKLYSDSIGEKKSMLNQTLSSFENFVYDYRFIRGLAVTLDRRCKMESKTPLSPIDVRRRLFQIAAKKGLPKTDEERKIILSTVANELKTGVEEVSESMYGDLEDEMILTDFNPIDPIDLLRQYNLSLTQTLLFNATELSFTASGNWKPIFRNIKWLGLIYSIKTTTTDYWVKVDGPMSLFKLTKRYGISLAKLLPTIVNNGYWRVEAKIIDRMDKTRLLNLELDGLRHGKYLKQTIEKMTFDSTIEEDFALRFKALNTSWELLREPEPLPVGKHVMIPDFLFKKDSSRVYLEIVGFWTPEYLEDKMKKLSMIKDVDMIVAVNRQLACQRHLKNIEHLKVFLYKGKIPLKTILNYLQEKERHLVDREVQALQNLELNLVEPTVEAGDIVKMLGISLEAVKRIIPLLKTPGYRRLSDIFIKENTLETIEKAISDRLEAGKLNFLEVSKLIESLSGKNPALILETLGYQVIWHGIDSESTEIRRKQPDK